jgi:hypothetical protein
MDGLVHYRTVGYGWLIGVCLGNGLHCIHALFMYPCTLKRFTLVQRHGSRNRKLHTGEPSYRTLETLIYPVIYRFTAPTMIFTRGSVSDFNATHANVLSTHITKFAYELFLPSLCGSFHASWRLVPIPCP